MEDTKKMILCNLFRILFPQTVIFLTIFTSGLLQPQSTQSQHVSSIGNFYGNFFTGSSAKIAARNTALEDSTRRIITTDLNTSHFLLAKKLTGEIVVPKYLKHNFKLSTVTVTAYYGPTENQDGKYFHETFEKEIQVNGEGKVTSYGTKTRIGIVATDPKVFPRGTKFLLVDPFDNREKIFVAEDIGSGIRGHHIDIFAGYGLSGYNRVKKIQSAGNQMIVKVLKASG